VFSLFLSCLSRAGTSRSHPVAGSGLSSFPKTVRPPLKREPGRLRAAKCVLTFSPCGDLEEERVVQRGRRAAGPSALAAHTLSVEFLV
jgi:hypothetical protein